MFCFVCLFICLFCFVLFLFVCLFVFCCFVFSSTNVKPVRFLEKCIKKEDISLLMTNNIVARFASIYAQVRWYRLESAFLTLLFI